MKPFIVIIVLLSVCNHDAQNSDIKWLDLKNRAVLSSAGSSHQNDQQAISWTLGNTLLTVSEETKLNSNAILEQLSVINIYPNPTSGKLMVSHKFNEDQEETNFKLDVYDLNGKLLYTNYMTNNLFELDLSPLPSAMYIIKVRSVENTLLKSYKIIKE